MACTGVPPVDKAWDPESSLCPLGSGQKDTAITQAGAQSGPTALGNSDVVHLLAIIPHACPSLFHSVWPGSDHIKCHFLPTSILLALALTNQLPDGYGGLGLGGEGKGNSAPLSSCQLCFRSIAQPVLCGQLLCVLTSPFPFHSQLPWHLCD